MRILVVGAGAIGGYFGGRLLAAGADVTFLVRSGRADSLRKNGLVIHSPLGDVTLPQPPTVLAQNINGPFDLVLLSCKAFDLDAAIDSFAPAVGPETAVLPLLNGVRHLEVLEARFGAKAVLGGQCFISVTLEADGHIAHLNRTDSLTFGEQDGSQSTRFKAILDTLSKGQFELLPSRKILQEMWEKWVFIATGAGITCLLRATVGDYVSAGATPLALALLAECTQIATDCGFAPSEATIERARGFITKAGSDFAASMLRDIERGSRTEVDQILGDLLRRRRTPTSASATSVLEIAHAHVQAYEARRARGT